MQISVTHDVQKITKHLDALQKRQVPVATLWAINNTAKLVKAAEEQAIKSNFDRPTKYTQNSLWIKWARRTHLEARIFLKDESYKGTPAAKYLGPQITGGQRTHKGFEKLLISKGMMPSNMYAVPSRTVKRDAYGNVSRGLIQRILSGLAAQRDIYQRATKGKGTHGKYFSGIIGNVHGIWDVTALHNGGPALLFIFTRAPSYRKRLDYIGIAQRTINISFNNEFRKAFAHAMATAR